jgi:DeoR/GlpR family transcriptional regulator of sugar metabolism
MSLEKMGIKTYCTGGLLCDGMLTGCLATSTLRQLSYDVCFFSVSGISDDGELTVVTEDFGTLLQAVFRRSKKSVCLCVDSKIGRRAFFSIGTLDVITHIISNVTFRNEIVSQYIGTEFIVIDM